MTCILFSFSYKLYSNVNFLVFVNLSKYNFLAIIVLYQITSVSGVLYFCRSVRCNIDNWYVMMLDSVEELVVVISANDD